MKTSKLIIAKNQKGKANCPAAEKAKEKPDAINFNWLETRTMKSTTKS
jgi:hypothetical protein